MKRSLILLAVLTVVALALGGLVLASANHGIQSITDAINAIGEVSFSEESRARIDAADAAIAAADPNLHLTDRVENLPVLRQAKVTYVEDAIIRLTRAARREAGKTIDLDLVRSCLADAEEAFSHFFTEEDAGDIGNYANLEKYRKEYGQDPTDVPSFQNLTPETDAEPIELC